MPKTNNKEKKLIILIYHISRLVRSKIISPADTSEPSMLQFQTLLFLSPTAKTMTVIAQELSVRLPTATAIIKRLVEAGWAVRMSDKKDKRNVYIKLSRKGKKILVHTMQTKMKRFHYIMEKIPEGDKESLYQIFTRLHQKLGGG